MQKYNKTEKPIPKDNSRVWLGVIFFFVGVALLLRTMGMGIVPQWIFRWPMILIIIGLVIGIKNQFQNPGSWILILIGFLFLLDESGLFMDLRRFVLPLILIIVGIVYILKPRKKPGDYIPGPSGPGAGNQLAGGEPGQAGTGEIIGTDEPESINVFAILGGVKKFVISKNFAGGSILTFMGGAEVNLSKSDITHPITLEINNMFGGTKLVIPPNWNLRQEATTILGGVEDKRNPNIISPDPGKTLVIRGTCMFGGIEITNF